MATIVLVFFLVAVLHFVYEFIVAPLLRFETRIRVLENRRKLRQVKSELGHALPSGTFHLVDDSLQALELVLPRIGVWGLFKFRYELAHDKSLRNEIELRYKKLKDCTAPNFVAIRDDISPLVKHAVRVNSGGWGIYVFPILVMYRLTRNIPRKFAVAPPVVISKVEPNSTMAMI